MRTNVVDVYGVFPPVLTAVLTNTTNKRHVVTHDTRIATIPHPSWSKHSAAICIDRRLFSQARRQQGPERAGMDRFVGTTRHPGQRHVSKLLYQRWSVNLDHLHQASRPAGRPRGRYSCASSPLNHRTAPTNALPTLSPLASATHSTRYVVECY